MKIARGLVLFAALQGLLSTAANADLIEYTAGHGDIGLAVEAGQLHLHYHFAPGAVLDGVPLPGGLPDEDYEYAPGDVYVRVSDAGKSTPGSTIPFLGNVPGSDVWVLPAVQNLAMPFLGFGTEELPDGFGAITYSLQAMNGPGNFALWSVDGFGTPTVEMSTLLGDTSMTLASGTHSHFNFGFTQAGIYELLLTATSVLTPSMTDTQSFFFAVGSSTPGVQGVPEPSSLLLASLAAAGFGVRRWRGRRTSPASAGESGVS